MLQPNQNNNPWSHFIKFLWELLTYHLAIRQKFGRSEFMIPLWLIILLAIPLSHLVLISLLIAIIAGYRVTFERKK
ncbi:hypothetical protein KKF05_01415 [Patescibacteria group bacterium]|nr:hypothetical protein [Patescibacteria group bacterium]MBU1916023.1 hypothetical protein [Patescibacteria group bacterium]